MSTKNLESPDAVAGPVDQLVRRLALSAACLLAAGCGERPVATAPTDNTRIQVDTLFTKDGCTVYRFVDAGSYRYFVRCESGQSRTEWRELCGKNCTRAVEVPGA